MAYLAQEDLEDAIGIPLLKAIFDDDQDGAPDERPIAACLDYATSEVESFLRAQYPAESFPLSPVPAEVKYAALDYAVAYAYRRRPDVVRAMGEQPWTVYRDVAEAKMQRFVAGRQRVSGALGAPASTTTSVRHGGADSSDEENVRVFDDMGDF